MMMFPNASKGYMPFCPSYDERKKAHDRRSRHRSGEDKKRKSGNNDPRKTHSTPTLTQYKIDKADLRFMSVPNLDLSRLHELWEDEDDKSKNESSVLKSFLGFFKKTKNDKVRAEPINVSRRRTDSEKENNTLLKPRLESIREEDENLDTSNSSVVSSGSSTTCKSTSSTSSITKPMAALRRQRTAMTALGTSPTSEAPAKKCATELHETEDNLDIKSTSSLISQDDCLKSQSDCSTSSSSIEKQG